MKTNKQYRKNYLNCPNCDSVDIDCIRTDYITKKCLSADYSCNSCNVSWQAYYKLHKYVPLTPQKKEK